MCDFVVKGVAAPISRPETVGIASDSGSYALVPVDPRGERARRAAKTHNYAIVCNLVVERSNTKDTLPKVASAKKQTGSARDPGQKALLPRVAIGHTS